MSRSAPPGGASTNPTLALSRLHLPNALLPLALRAESEANQHPVFDSGNIIVELDVIAGLSSGWRAKTHFSLISVEALHCRDVNLKRKYHLPSVLNTEHIRVFCFYRTIQTSAPDL